jgi:hypothetical protein
MTERHTEPFAEEERVVQATGVITGRRECRMERAALHREVGW